VCHVLVADVFPDEKAGEYGCLQRVHVLLQYIEHLERILYNAYEGLAVAMAPPPKVKKKVKATCPKSLLCT
jgi:hypothetical protein